ncbi:AraC family transcriptional regulator [Nocardia neocaledoniensis]|uniref:AraC family transcriptional regulator n=1 Tax=Nocardia neocaledoniensis TaxID=236511 RepID=UPI0024546525|nr:helix-turn-helix domain-containing protein [Nocardia neocaledoniensis]
MRPIMSDQELDGGWELVRARSPRWAGASLAGFRDRAAAGSDMRIVALPAVTMVVQAGESPLTDAGTGARHGGLVAGLAPGTPHLRSDRVDCVEVRLSPITACSLLGVAPRDLHGGVTGLAEIWGARAELLQAQLSETSSWDARFEVVTRFLAEGASPHLPDPEVAACWRRILADGGDVRVTDLTELTGWSHKRLWSRFTDQIGVTPKRAAMVVRFRRAFDRLVAGESAADVAIACGYVDQSHLHRDIVTFAGTTPGALALR